MMTTGNLKGLMLVSAMLVAQGSIPASAYERAEQALPYLTPQNLTTGPVQVIPANFPVPIISGKGTRIVNLPGLAALFAGSSNCTTVLLKTEYGVEESYRWYCESLRRKGFQLLSSKQLPGDAQRIIEAESGEASCRVLITSQSAQETIIQILYGSKAKIQI